MAFLPPWCEEMIDLGIKCPVYRCMLFINHLSHKVTFAIVGRAITLEKVPSKKKQRTNTKMAAKRFKSDNFTRSNRENE